jgi:hypothetical protein
VKRIILLLLLGIYTTATLGVSVKSFYCCNKLKSTTIAFTQTAEKTCGMEEDGMDNCCRTTYHYYKVKDNHFGENTYSGMEKVFTDWSFSHTTIEATSIYATSLNSIAYKSNPPPLKGIIPIYIYNCTYRI